MKKFVVVLEEIMQSEIVVYAADAEEAEEEAKMWYDRDDAVSSGLEVVENYEVEEEQAAVENWHIDLTQNQGFVGSSPTCGTKSVLAIDHFPNT